MRLWTPIVIYSTQTPLYSSKPSEEDLGTYRCQVNSGIDEVKLEAVFYNENDQNWLMILIIIIICIFLLVLLTLCIICVRKRARRKGRYGVKDVADGKRTIDLTFNTVLTMILNLCTKMLTRKV